MAKALLAVVLWLFVSTSVLAASPQKKPPQWAGLSSEQQQILAPLATDWDKFDVQRKRKWLGIAKRYPTLSPAEQEKVKQNMQPWAQLTPEERRVARERFKNLQRLPPEKRKTLPQAWEEYQRLPEDQRKQLEAAGKAPKPESKSRARIPAPVPEAAK
jgi:hypothetical protein